MDPTALLTELAKHIAAATGLTFDAPPGNGRDLFMHHLPDNQPGWAAESVIRITGGEPKRFDPIERIFVQVMTRAADRAIAMQRASVIYAALLDANGLPLRRLPLGVKWFAYELDVTFPQVIGLDEAGRDLVVSNLNITAGSLAA